MAVKLPGYVLMAETPILAFQFGLSDREVSNDFGSDINNAKMRKLKVAVILARKIEVFVCGCRFWAIRCIWSCSPFSKEELTVSSNASARSIIRIDGFVFAEAHLANLFRR